MKLQLLRIALVVFSMSVASTELQAQYLNPKITGKQTVIHQVVVLPAKVEIVRQSMKGPEGMAAESDLLSARITELVTEILTARHLSARALAAISADDSEKKYGLADLQSRYDTLLPKITKKPKDVKTGRFSMGDEVLNFKADKDADSIVFIRGQGQKLTSGKKTFNLLVGGVPAYLTLTIGIIDAHSGEVLVFTSPVARGDATDPNNKSLRKAIEKSLKKLPG